MIREEIYRELYVAIQELPERNREIFALYVLGKNDDEIAESLSLDEHVVHEYKKEAIHFLKNRLGNQFYWFLWMKNIQLARLLLNDV